MCLQLQSIAVLWYSDCLLEPECIALAAMGHVAAKATWPQRENVQTYWVNASHQVRKRKHLCSSGIISLGVRWTRCFFKRINHLHRLTQALDGSTSQLNVSFSGLHQQASSAQHFPPRHFDFYCIRACLPLLWPGHLVRKVEEGGVLILVAENSCKPLGCEALASWLASRLIFLVLLNFNV